MRGYGTVDKGEKSTPSLWERMLYVYYLSAAVLITGIHSGKR